MLIPAGAKSWIEVDPNSDFPIQNLPLGFVQLDEFRFSAATRIGDKVLAFGELYDVGLIDADEIPDLDQILAVTVSQARELRRVAYEVLRSDSPQIAAHPRLLEGALFDIADVEVLLPMDIPAFVDFYSGINHASNVGKMFRPDMPPLLPNYRHLPVAYNGRASTVDVSGAPIHRPNGIQKVGDEVVFGPTKELDYELEIGFFVGDDTEGATISPDEASDFILGAVLVNDWSARDVQRFEYQPLGPFLAKSFASTISPWIVTMDALAPFAARGPKQDPEPLPHLRQNGDSHYDIHLEVLIQTPRMSEPQAIARTNSKELYWSFGQQLAHQASNGTLVEMGDLYASGTISGENPGSFGSLLEATWRGTQPIHFEETGESRTFLEDGDTVIMRGWCQGDGYRIGFGELRNVIAR